MKKIVFISCVSKKLSREAKAEELYVSDLFKKNLAYARSLQPEIIYILSAKYGLVGLEETIDTYDLTLKAMREPELRAWGARVLAQLQGKIDFKKDEAVFLAGERYRKHLVPHFTHTQVPLRGLGIGRQLQYLKKALHV